MNINIVPNERRELFFKALELVNNADKIMKIFIPDIQIITLTLSNEPSKCMHLEFSDLNVPSDTEDVLLNISGSCDYVNITFSDSCNKYTDLERVFINAKNLQALRL
jgi:hypothetical protein